MTLPFPGLFSLYYFALINYDTITMPKHLPKRDYLKKQETTFSDFIIET